MLNDKAIFYKYNYTGFAIAHLIECIDDCTVKRRTLILDRSWDICALAEKQYTKNGGKNVEVTPQEMRHFEPHQSIDIPSVRVETKIINLSGHE